MRTLTAKIATKYMKVSSESLELHVFDFDHTLFRSPEPPEWWNNKKMGYFFNEVISLGEPFVPERPSNDYWVGSVVREAKKSIGNMNTLAIMCTGRPDNNGAMRYRVAELLKGAGLDFDEVHLKPGSGSTAKYKAKLVFDLLKRYPNITSVSVWEDSQENLDAIKKVCDKLSVEFQPHLVDTTPYPVTPMKEEYEAMMRRASMRRRASAPNMVDALEINKSYGPRRTPGVCVEALARRLLTEGLGFIKDEHYIIKSLTESDVRKSLISYIDEEYTLFTEMTSHISEDRYPEIADRFHLSYSKAKRGRIKVEEVISPRTGVHGWKITLR